MTWRSTIISLLALLAADSAESALSGWDSTQLELLEQYSTPLRWHNIEGSPYRVAGAKIRHPFASRLHAVQLRPGESITLRLPESRWFRIMSENQDLAPADLEVSVSIDGQAYASLPWVTTSDAKSLLISLPERPACLLRLGRPDQALSPLTVAAFFYMEEPFDTFAPCREIVRLPGKRSHIRREDQAASWPAWQVSPREGTQFVLSGPARLELSAVLPWPTNEPHGEQTPWIQATLDGVELPPLLLSADLDGQNRTRINHAPQLVSHLMRGFITVPIGAHSLRLRPNVPLYLSVFREAPNDFLLPSLNTPGTNALQALWLGLVSCRQEPSLPSCFPKLPLDAYLFADQEQGAWRLARQNTARDTGAQAADALDRISKTRLDYPPAQETAKRLWREKTAYREVLPARLPSSQPFKGFLFTPGNLRGLYDPDQPIAVCNPTIDQVQNLFVEGRFVTLSEEPASACIYDLPARSFDTDIRISAIPSGKDAASFYVQYDQDPPIRILVNATNPIALGDLEAPAAMAALAVVETEARFLTNAPPTIPAGAFDLPFPVSKVGTAELPLPQAVRRVRIFREDSGPPVAVSLACRASQPFEPGEASYLALLEQAGATELLRLLVDGQDNETSAPESTRQLQNALLPLARMLRADEAGFTNSIDVSSPGQPAALLSPPEAAELRTNALRLAKSGSLIEAVETWNRVFWGGGPDCQLEAAASMMGLLGSLGEDFLAAQYARFVLLRGSDAAVLAAAAAFLAAQAERTEDTESLEQTRSFLFLRHPGQENLSGLVEALARNDRDDMVLQAGLLLPPAARPRELMLGAALRRNWWQTFDRLLKDLPSAQARSFWRAQKHLAFLNFARAEEELRNAGACGAETLRALQAGGEIRSRLLAPDLRRRLEALFAWEQWQTNCPGPKAWRKAEDVEVAAAATERIVNSELNQFDQFLRADPDRPVTLRFPGPVRLQIEARVILDQPFQNPVDDWLVIAEFGVTNRVPVFQAVPNPVLKFAMLTNALASVRTFVNLEWGPGLHVVKVSLAGRSGLIRVQQEQPLLPLRILPQLNLRRLDLVLDSSRLAALAREDRPRCKSNGTFWRVPFDVARSAADAQPSGDPFAREALHARIFADPGLPPVERLRLALRLDWQGKELPAASPEDLSALPVAEQWLAALRSGRPGDFQKFDSLSPTERANLHLASRRTGEALALKQPADLLQYLVTLLRISEECPSLREEAECLAEWRAAEAGYPAGSRKILARLLSDRVWQPFPLTPLSAGLRPLRVPADLAQDPGTRLRRALLPPAATNQFTVSAESEFAASLSLLHPANVRLTAELVRAGFSPPAPLSVSLQVDDLPVERLSLAPPIAAAHSSFTLTNGPHLVRAWIDNPVVNQSVRISIEGDSPGVTNSIWSKLAGAAIQNRYFYAATRSQPVRFAWKGPALLRVDEWREGALLSQVRFVPAGEQTVEIGPAEGRAESSYRIFLRVSQTNKVEAQAIVVLREPNAMPGPVLALPPTPPPAVVQLADYYRLGGQEDGTLTTGFLLAHRAPFEIKSQHNVNEFLEADGAYRKAAASGTLWFNTDGLVRLHRPGDLTLGLGETVEGRPRNALFEWCFSAQAFGGWLGSARKDFEASVYSAFELGQRRHLNRKLDLYAFGSLFGHYLTLTQADAPASRYVDQDLYTRYRATHRWGGKLGFDLEYRPWLDTVLKAGPAVIGNEDFTPDHWGLRVSWNQLLGPVRAEVGYGFDQYLADADRSSQSSLQAVSAGLYAELWVKGRHRIELGGNFRHDWPGSVDSYFVVLRWDFSNGRGYTDYGPGEMAFRQLRNAAIPAGFNNRLQTGD